MDKTRLTSVLPLAAALSLAGCGANPTRGGAGDLASALHLVTPIAATRHDGDDDLLTAGLGAAGLRSPVPPALADAAHPSAAELRRRAIWTNWRGIADFAPGGGYGEVYGFVAPVPGREFQALAKLPGARQPHRVLLQLPDAFDPAHPCVVVTASSGSRGVYGAIALAGSWGLSKHCAVAYTDKGTGTGYVDTGAPDGARLDGTRGTAGEGVVEFDAPPAAADLAPGMAPIATKHAHSGDNPEADWGRHVQQAAAFALRVLGEAYPERRFDAASTRIIAVGVSNGGGAVLRAAELPGDWLDAVVAVSPNVLAPDGGRALYDYTTEAALFAPCALDAPAFDAVALARPGGKPSPAGAARCASLQAAGLLPAGSAAEGAAAAHAHLRAQGWSDGAIAAAALSTGFDLFRAVAVTYASAYTRSGPGTMPCGYAFRVVGADGAPRATTAAERALWWSDGSGIPPGAGIGIVDGTAMTVKSAGAAADPAFAGLRCLRALWDDPQAPGHDALHAGVQATRAALPRAGLPVLVMHGADDGLIPEAFGAAAYARDAKSAGRDVRYWQVANAQHFDAFLGLPPLAARYVPMLAYAYHGLDRIWAHLEDGAPLPADARIASTPRAATAAGIAPLDAKNLGALP
jgi:hydroxybutyrate-dimer hydrolase